MKWLNGLCAILLTSSLIAASLGCREESASSDRAATTASQPQSPEESFALIYETFRRGVETRGGVPGGFIATDEDGHSRLTVDNKVSHELFSPDNKDDSYRATITLVSVTRYSLARGLGEDDDEEKTEGQQESSSEGASPPENDASAVLDPNLISTSNPSDDRSEPKNTAVARRDDREERKFHLVYQDGRWRLTEETQKKLNPETEQAIINAFDMALGKQA